ncbi:metal-dependent hydrolase [Acetivibrio saccincola]|uniref:Inner membrane protein n=4 Tax=Acetivibrio saccincola TaxID=1677857 RepID=A0A2K9E3I4_9FIRM|nr:metal-dependent hydrolase [Acetivibrio saccincola]AUG58292.1 inner membrane protein [Acetivibrio saccincola]
MDPLTHGVIGIALAKATGNEVSIADAATAAVVVGAVFPDIDIVFQKWGDYVYLKNHRGITHSVLGLVTSSVFIAFLLNFFYPGYGLLNLAFWALLGGISHTFFDIFNSYGAKLLWPFINKKFSLSLLTIFDPIFLISILGYIFTTGKFQNAFIIGFMVYLLFRVAMRLCVFKHLKKNFGKTSEKISLLPSMTGLFRWHFILEKKESSIVGEKNIFKKNVKLIKKLYKIQDDILEKVSKSNVGKFFADFTPIFHVDRELAGGITRYVFIDMRYYMRDKFLHHAILEMDEDGKIITSSFNPYSIKRVSKIPEGFGSRGSIFSRIIGA